MKRNIFLSTIAILSLGLVLVASSTFAQGYDRRNDYNRNNPYNDNHYDDYSRNAPSREFPLDPRNPYDERSRVFDTRNPYDPRPVYDNHSHGRYNDYDYRCNCDTYSYCSHRQQWANRYFPVDPRNPYDIRNNPRRFDSYSYNNRRGRERVVIVVPERGHHHRRDW